MDLLRTWHDFQTVRREANKPIAPYIRHVGPFVVWEAPSLRCPYGEARSRLPRWLVWLAHRTAVVYS